MNYPPGVKWEAAGKDHHPLEDEIHVWSVAIDATDLDSLGSHYILSSLEQEKARRYYFEKDRRQYLVTRSWLRILLGRYLNQDPRALLLGESPKGKPFLEGPASPCCFNVSHSAGLALLAFRARLEVGVDLERIDPARDFTGIAERYFCQEEKDQLTALSEGERLNYFFRLWTGKEALLKAWGEGLHRALNQILLREDPESQGMKIFDAGGKVLPNWALLELEPPSRGFCAALASSAPLGKVRLIRGA